MEIGRDGKSFVVTSGTGSGKSLTYIATIYDYLLRHREESKGLTALIVYPMNALINSQYKAFLDYLKAYLELTGRMLPITCRRYTGQEDQEERKAVQDSLPDILLTNYMMLEPVLTRHGEARLRSAIRDALDKLPAGSVEIQPSTEAGDYEERYRALLAETDPNSDLERRFLDHLRAGGLRLPDEAQPKVPGIYCMPDFLYRPDVYVFCDGSVHDGPAERERDREQRDALRAAGYQDMVLRHTDDLAAFTDRRPDVFPKVR